MPSINGPLDPNIGPIISVLIFPSVPRQEALRAAGLPLPQGQRANFLIDTGASCTCVDPAFLTALGLTPTGVTPIQTPSTAGSTHVCSLYDVMLFIPSNGPGTNGHLIDALPIVATQLSSQGIDGLLGRDVLNNCTLFFNGSASMYTLAY